jgi:hypothetical protein
VPKEVIVRDVFLGLLPPGAAVTAENLDLWGVVDATQSGVEEGVHNYSFESVGGARLPDSDLYAGYTIVTALDSRLGSGAMFARRFPILGAS